MKEYVCISDDVTLGKNVILSKLINLYGCTIGDNTKVGAFVEILPGTDGLVHISQLADGRTEKVEDVVKEGDEIEVKVVEIDSMGRINLSRKAVLRENK